VTGSIEHQERHHPGGPAGKVVGALAPSTVDAVREALVAAGYDGDRIDVMTAEEVQQLDSPFTEDGLRGIVDRFVLSLGEDLSAMEELRQEAIKGRVLVGVPVTSEEASLRVSQILHEHGAHEVTHFGRWSVSSH
jgi:hypothetical protein